MKVFLLRIFLKTCVADLTLFCTAICLFFIVFFNYFSLNEFAEPKIFG